jgi:RNA polymerase sigma-70 factor (ECF subfamily)
MTILANVAPDILALQRPFLYRFALSRTRHRETAEEVVQETLLAALESYARFKGDSALRTWLAGILKHKLIDWYRREECNPANTGSAGTNEVSYECDDTTDVLFDSTGAWVTPPSEWPGPDQSLEAKQFREMLDRCLSALPSSMARAFYLREIEGMTIEEICAELGISESNCWVMLYRARVKVRQHFEKHWFLGNARCSN